MYEMKNRVTYSQVKSDLKTDMAVLAHYFQDCTIFHSESIGKGFKEITQNNKAWFLSSWQIEVDRYPEFKEEIVVRTWPHAFKGLYGYRNFDILDKEGKRVAGANSIWVFMDLKKMCPVKPTEQDMEGYDLEPALEMEYAPRKIKILDIECQIEEMEGAAPIVVKKSFLDSNHHVNNGRYVAEALDFLQGDKSIKKMRVDYRRAAALGDKMYPAVFENEDCCQVVFSDEKGNPFVIVEVL